MKILGLLVVVVIAAAVLVGDTGWPGDLVHHAAADVRAAWGSL